MISGKKLDLQIFKKWPSYSNLSSKKNIFNNSRKFYKVNRNSNNYTTYQNSGLFEKQTFSSPKINHVKDERNLCPFCVENASFYIWVDIFFSTYSAKSISNFRDLSLSVVCFLILPHFVPQRKATQHRILYATGERVN